MLADGTPLSGSTPLRVVFDGWDSNQISLVRAIAPLSPQQLAFRPAPRRRSTGAVASHISLGRIGWFERMGAPGSDELARQAAAWDAEALVVENASELVRRLEATWQMIDETLARWTVADLAQTYRHTYWGKTYAISRQWTIWRIMAHDIHHGGELSALLGIQGVEAPELGDLGGHLTEPPLAEP